MDKLVGVNICGSHPHFSDSDGATYNLAASFLSGMKYHIIKTPAAPEKAPLIGEGESNIVMRPTRLVSIELYQLMQSIDSILPFYQLTSIYSLLSLHRTPRLQEDEHPRNNTVKLLNVFQLHPQLCNHRELHRLLGAAAAGERLQVGRMHDERQAAPRVSRVARQRANPLPCR